MYIRAELFVPTSASRVDLQMLALMLMLIVDL